MFVMEESARLRWVRKRLDALCPIDRDNWTELDVRAYRALYGEEDELLEAEQRDGDSFPGTNANAQSQRVVPGGLLA